MLLRVSVTQVSLDQDWHLAMFRNLFFTFFKMSDAILYVPYTFLFFFSKN